MPEYGMGMGVPGAYLSSNQRFARLLGKMKDPNNGTLTGGIASVLTKGLQGYLAGQDMRAEQQAQERARAAANDPQNRYVGSYDDFRKSMADSAARVGPQPGSPSWTDQAMARNGGPSGAPAAGAAPGGVPSPDAPSLAGPSPAPQAPVAQALADPAVAPQSWAGPDFGQGVGQGLGEQAFAGQPFAGKSFAGQSFGAPLQLPELPAGFQVMQA